MYQSISESERRTDWGQHALQIGACLNFAVALGHLVLGFAVRSVMQVLGSPQWIVEMLRDNPMQWVLTIGVLAALFTVFGLYGLSGAGSMRRLPLLRSGLIGIAAIYLLRSLELIDNISQLLQPDGRLLPLGFSLGALCVGLCYLAGTIRRWPQLKPTKPATTAQLT